MLDDALRVPLGPWRAWARVRVLLVERDQDPDKLALHWGRSQHLGQLGEVEQPVCVPRRPVRVVPVDDAVHLVMRLAGLVKESGDADGLIVHVPSLAKRERGAQAPGRLNVLAED